LYFGLSVIENVLTNEDQFGFMFDNSHNGVIDVNDDSGGFSGLGIFGDGHFNGTEWIIDESIQGMGAAQHDGTRAFWEFSKPLSSGNEDDLNVSIGDTVGFCLTYVRDGIATDTTQYGPACRLVANEQKLYGDVLIIPFSLVWHGKMAMDADKRNINYGELIQYEGYLYGDNLIKDESVMVKVSEQDTGKIIQTQKLIPDSESVEYFENTAWKFSFNIDTSKTEFEDDTSYVVEATYADESTKLNFLIKPDTKPDLKEKATEAGGKIVEAGKETGEFVVETGKEAGKAIVEAGSEAAEKGAIVGEVAVEKGAQAGQAIIEKGSEGIGEIQEKGGGCLIATAAYGSELAPQIQFLREIRDNTVMSTASGAYFMNGFNQFYYSFSPNIADLERENPAFQETVRLFITPMISSLSIMTLADQGNDLQVVGLGMSIIALHLGMYVAAPAFVGITINKKLKSKTN